jgi:hypothetical protein
MQPNEMYTMNLEHRKFALRGPLSLLMFNGRLAFWSRDDPPILIWLDSAEAAMLLQFTAAPREAAEAAKAVGAERTSEIDRLIDKLVQHRMLSEHVDSCDEPFYPLYSPEIKKEDAVCLVESAGLGSQMVRDISNGLITSGLVGENAWSNHFAGTRGFGVKFRREALDTLIKLMPWTRPYFDKVLDENVARHFCAGRSEKSQPNAFYFNALVIPPGRGTSLHVDKTLAVTTPILVSVLYLETTTSPGGLLYLTEKTWPVGLVNPRPGMIVHFRGNLAHGVSRTPLSGVVRSSLICEQYVLNEEQIESCPQLELVVR